MATLVAMSAPVLLAIDSSTESLCVCAAQGERMAARVGEGGAQASARLLADVRQVLSELGQPLTSLAAVAFGRGPGAFTGLRSACSVAQGLAFGLDCPVLPIDSLLVLAEAARGVAGPEPGTWRDVAVVNDARMGEVYAGRWGWRGDEWQAIEPVALWRPEVLDRAWQHAPITAWVGTGIGELPASGRRGVHTVTDLLRAQALLRLAQRAWARGEAVPASQALPAYVRDKVAQTTQERQQAASQRANAGA
jgi:tRNA threonylcarbamoyladenosine biosynthesis protein TsaB